MSPQQDFETKNKFGIQYKLSMLTKYQIMPEAKCWNCTTEQYQLTAECDDQTLLVMLNTTTQNFRHEFTTQKGLQEFNSVTDMFEMMQNPEFCTIDWETGTFHFKYEKVMGKKKWWESFQVKLNVIRIQNLFQIEKPFRKMVHKQFMMEDDTRGSNSELKKELQELKKEVKEKINQLKYSQFQQFKKGVEIQIQQNKKSMKNRLSERILINSRSMEDFQKEVNNKICNIQERSNQQLIQMQKAKRNREKIQNNRLKNKLKNEVSRINNDIVQDINEKMEDFEVQIRELKKNEKHIDEIDEMEKIQQINDFEGESLNMPTFIKGQPWSTSAEEKLEMLKMYSNFIYEKQYFARLEQW